MDTFQRQLITSLGVLVAAFLFGYLVRSVLVRHLSRVFQRTPTDLDDLLLAATRRHLPFWGFLAGAVIAARLAPISEKAVHIVDRLAAMGFVVSMSLAASSMAIGLISRRTQRAGTSLGTTTLVQSIVRVLIFATGALLLLSNLGISITPLLAALGVGSLAVALALQPTLANLVAGLHVTLARPIRVGDFVQLESGISGYVDDIGWRATRIRELSDNIVVVPNNRVAEMVVTNYNMPAQEQSITIRVGVAYDSDLEKVERVTCDVAQSILRTVEGGVPGFEPFIRYNSFGESSIDFSATLRVKTYTDRFLITHRFIKELKVRFGREGIEIPLPQRVIHASVREIPGFPTGGSPPGGGSPSELAGKDDPAGDI